MKIGDKKHFCTCLLDRPNSEGLKEHVTMPDEEGCCIYCGYYTMERKVTKHDLNTVEKYGRKIEELKKQALDLYAKERIHAEKIN